MHKRLCRPICTQTLAAAIAEEESRRSSTEHLEDLRDSLYRLEVPLIYYLLELLQQAKPRNPSSSTYQTLKARYLQLPGLAQLS